MVPTWLTATVTGIAEFRSGNCFGIRHGSFDGSMASVAKHWAKMRSSWEPVEVSPCSHVLVQSGMLTRVMRTFKFSQLLVARQSRSVLFLLSLRDAIVTPRSRGLWTRSPHVWIPVCSIIVETFPRCLHSRQQRTNSRHVLLRNLIQHR